MHTVRNSLVILHVLMFVCRYRIVTEFDEAGYFKVDPVSGNITAFQLDYDFRYVRSYIVHCTYVSMFVFNGTYIYKYIQCNCCITKIMIYIQVRTFSVIAV